ncbi:uncharacterized protein LOC142488092 [Ascaphus truei]|uniref:uncharacterized protein LOC142488092 n=1 Tax=Ascaphus truei TaxID=8439 RepID=UPI003F5ABC5A
MWVLSKQEVHAWALKVNVTPNHVVAVGAVPADVSLSDVQVQVLKLPGLADVTLLMCPCLSEALEKGVELSQLPLGFRSTEVDGETFTQCFSLTCDCPRGALAWEPRCNCCGGRFLKPVIPQATEPAEKEKEAPDGSTGAGEAATNSSTSAMEVVEGPCAQMDFPDTEPEPPKAELQMLEPPMSKLKKKIQHQRVHATGTGGGPTPQRLILTPLEELLRAKLLPVVVEGLPGDRDIGIYPSQFPPVAPEGHVSPETEQVSSPGSASSTHLEEHDEEDYDDDDDDDAAAAIDTQIQASDHEEVPIETVLPPNRPANTTYDAIVASEGKIVEAENRRHSDLMTVLERMIALQEETVSQLAHLHRVFIEVPKQLQKINTSFEALVVQQTQANYLRMTNVSQFNINTSQAGSVHAGQFSPHSSDLHSPGPNVTGQVADIAVQVPNDILPLPSGKSFVMRILGKWRRCAV